MDDPHITWGWLPYTWYNTRKKKEVIHMNILHYVGLDVDDKNFHGAIYKKETGEIVDFKTKPNAGALVKKINSIIKPGERVKMCYEATHIGYPLCREINKKKNMECEIIAPSLIPEIIGRKRKTDRLDCRKLAEYYAKDLLTKIYIPKEEDVINRGIMRTRSFMVKQRKEIKLHILSTCRSYGINYREETDKKSYWTKNHRNWINSKVKEMDSTVKYMFEVILFQLDMTEKVIKELEEKIMEMAETKKYKKRKDALIKFEGISVLTAMTIILEVVDIKRFAHPKQLTSYVGLDITEYSSGGKERKYSITKAGNKHIRAVLLEGLQIFHSGQTLSKRLKQARKERDGEGIVKIAEKCSERLRKKRTKMMIAGKHYNKIKVACARELLCFVWEALYKVA